MEEEEVRRLLMAYRMGTISSDDRLMLESWYSKKVSEPIETLSDEQLQVNLEILWQDVQQKNKVKRISRPIAFAIPAAAVVLISVTLGLFFFFSDAVLEQQPDNDVMPGGNKAILITGSGQSIDLDEGRGAILVGPSGIIYNDGESVLAGSDRYTIQTPRGGKYHVTLSDGSQVWLNSASTMHYPARFEEDKREVTVEGEAYFQVSHRAYNGKRTPFIVKTNGQEINVLGTTFNVSAYGDDEKEIVTLVKGKVSVASAHQALPVMLAPGQESVLTDGGTEIRQADLASALAWKEDKFRFHESELHEVMQQLSRWYDLEIVYSGHIPETFFYGVISRDRTLAAVLELLKEGGVNFKIEISDTTNRLIVLP